ncbi:MAG: ATP-dependent DNA ligase [Desulfotomaculum sp.]|nr:ATP-dependent DNA ligase [Desulfotomaculum sp.]
MTEKLPLIKPMLAVPAEPFDSPDYIYELKWDGYRCLAYLNNKNTELRSRNLINLTPSFPEHSKLHRQVNDLPVILDGEIVVLQDGMPSFSALQSRGRLREPLKIKQAARRIPAVYVVFDVLYKDGKPVMHEPLVMRKEMLAEIITVGEGLLLPEYIKKEGNKFYKACADRGLEGIMAKRADSPYLPGRRSHYWKKIRCTRSAELVICGFEPGSGANLLGSLVLGGYRNDKLVYQGKVGTGFTQQEQERLVKLLNQLEVKTPPFKVPLSVQKKTRWVKPLLVCEVYYTGVTPGNCLRHPSYKGLRLDKNAEECRALTI